MIKLARKFRILLLKLDLAYLADRYNHHQNRYAEKFLSQTLTVTEYNSIQSLKKFYLARVEDCEREIKRLEKLV